jgi:lipopolysaccharide export system protein LptA
MCYRFLVTLCLPVYLLLSAHFAIASSGDIQQPINIEADRAELDQQKQISTYTGNVVLRQGGIEIKAATVKVFTQDGSLQHITAEGNPVQFSQQGEGEEDIHGTSLRVEYKTQPKHVLLLGKAELWQGKNHFSGERIEYDPGQEKVIATGAGDGKSSGKGRVKIILHPETIKQNNDDSANGGLPKEKP